MRLSRAAERELLLECERNRDDHITFSADAYVREDGALTVHRDGVQELLHRRLFRLLRDPDLGRRKLTRTCSQRGCVQPYHYMVTAGLRRGARRHCPNGHDYRVVGVTPSGHCLTCANVRARLRAGAGNSVAARNAAKCCCPRDHEYTPANTYLQSTPSGTRRKCRRCNADRAALRRSLNPS